MSTLCRTTFLAALTFTRVSFAADLTQSGNITIDPPASGTLPAALSLVGPKANSNDPSPYGLTLSFTDHAPVDEPPYSIGTFTLRRPVGLYSWEFGAANPGNPNRVAMVLDEANSLSLHDPAEPADPAQSYAIVLNPRGGAEGGIFYHGARLLTAAETGVVIGGGLLHTPYDPYTPDPNIQPLYASPGVMAVGSGASAFGDQAIALGAGAQAGFHSQAMGEGAVALYYSTAIGSAARADNHGMAIGSNSHAVGYYSLAYGSNAFSYGFNTLAFGNARTGSGYNSVAMNADAWGSHSFAAAWGTADGEASIALGGYAGGYKSLAANSGATLAETSTAFGPGALTRRRNQIAVGAWNVYPAIWNDPGTWGQDPLPGDSIFIVGNGSYDGAEHRSNAFTIGYNGDARIQGRLTVDGTPKDGGPSATVFAHDVNVQGVLRVPAAGDLSMGDFTAVHP